MPRVVELFGVVRRVFAVLINQHEPCRMDFGTIAEEKTAHRVVAAAPI
jgi:hypothetical protein